MQSNKTSRIQGLKNLLRQYESLKIKHERALDIQQRAAQRLDQKKTKIFEKLRRDSDETSLIVNTNGKSYLLEDGGSLDIKIKEVKTV